MKYLIYLLLGMFLISFASAFSGSGSGTLADPYQITSWTQMQEIWNDLKANYTLMNDLNSSNPDYSGLADNWLPIGNDTLIKRVPLYRFTGSFNGQNHTISDLIVNRPSNNYNGLFGYAPAFLRNFKIKNSSVTGYDYNGLVAGSMSGAALVGLTNIYFEGEVYGHSYVGGAVGAGSSVNSYNSGNVSVNGSGDNVGCFVGHGSSTDSYNSSCTGNVNGNTKVGGFIGYEFGGTTQDCYSTANVTGVSLVGGFFGGTGSTYTNVYRSYSTGNVTGSSNVGGFAYSYVAGGTFTEIYWDVNTSGQLTSALGTGKTTDEMKNISTFTNWNISYTSINRNDGYPFLAWEVGNTSAVWLIWDGTTPEPPSENCWTKFGHIIFIPTGCLYNLNSGVLG